MHEEQKELIDRLLDGELNTEEEQNLREHLRGCNDCFSYYVQMKHMRDALAEQKAERLDETWMNGMKQKLKKERKQKTLGHQADCFICGGAHRRCDVGVRRFGGREPVGRTEQRQRI
jgi:anti-sigma factor RsiW